MMGWFTDLFRKTPPPQAEQEDAVTAAFRDGHCPDCGGTQIEVGPSGGISHNVTCVGCGSRFNLHVAYGHGIIRADRI
jgi:ribosomal protein S27E